MCGVYDINSTFSKSASECKFRELCAICKLCFAWSFTVIFRLVLNSRICWQIIWEARCVVLVFTKNKPNLIDVQMSLLWKISGEVNDDWREYFHLRSHSAVPAVVHSLKSNHTRRLHYRVNTMICYQWLLKAQRMVLLAAKVFPSCKKGRCLQCTLCIWSSRLLRWKVVVVACNSEAPTLAMTL